MGSAQGRGLASTKPAQCLRAPKSYSVSGQVKALDNFQKWSVARLHRP